MNNEDKIKYIEEKRRVLANKLKEKCDEIESASSLYKKSSRPNKYGGWKDEDGDIANITYQGLEYKYYDSDLSKLFSIDDLQEMINI